MISKGRMCSFLKKTIPPMVVVASSVALGGEFCGRLTNLANVEGMMVRMGLFNESSYLTVRDRRAIRQVIGVIHGEKDREGFTWSATDSRERFSICVRVLSSSESGGRHYADSVDSVRVRKSSSQQRVAKLVAE